MARSARDLRLAPPSTLPIPRQNRCPFDECWTAYALPALGGTVLAIIAALLWTIDKVFRQKTVLERLSVTDVLTELPNRRGLLQHAEQMLAQHRRHGRPLSLALMDLDDFKIINDGEGHPVGDAVRHHVAHAITQSTRGSDMLARLGGEAFGLLMPETDRKGAYELCERIRQRIEAMELPMTQKVRHLTVSVGLTTTLVNADTSFDNLYADADLALYEAKREGRNRTIVQRG